MTEEMFNVKFTELNEDNYKKADLRYILFETSDSTANSQAWHPASENHSYIYLLTSYGGKYDDYSAGSVSYGTILHETGHALNLAHPFDGTKIENSQNTTLFSVMAYDAFWLRTTDTYGIATGNGSSLYKGNVADYENYLSYSSWDLHDIAALGYMYGYRTNYKSEDTIYTFSPSINIHKTIHDMAGNDTINLSNYTDNTTISLIPGGVSEIGSNKLFWEGDNQQSGDYFVLSFKTDIENYIGSSGNDDVTLNSSIINDISTGAGKDIIKNSLPTDIINTQGDDDTVYVSISSLTEIKNSITINGGDGYDWLVIKSPSDISPSLDFSLTDLSTHFDNFEGYDFTNNESNTVILTEDDFISGLKIKGDSNDEISLPLDAVQTSSDDLYLYYTLSDVEVAISVDLLLV
jgi:serralysin